MNLDVPAACEVRKIETRVEAVAAGFVEHTTVELRAGSGCDALGVRLPPAVQLGEHSAKLRFSDDTRRKLDEARWRFAPRSLDDEGGVTVLAPELLAGDLLYVSFDRLWPATGFVWAPDAVGAKVALIDAHLLPAGQAVAAGRAEPKPDQMRMVYLPGDAAAPPLAKVNPGVVVVSRPAQEAVTLSADALPGDDPAAWQDALAARWVGLPRGVDGAWPLTGDAAIARGAGDDRGFARTLVARAAQPDAPTAHTVTLAWALPDGAVAAKTGHPPPDAIAEVAVWTTPTGPVVLLPPGLAAPAALWDGAPVPTFTARATAGPAPGAPPRVRRITTLEIPGRDPQIALYPGGRAQATVAETLEFDAADGARAWFVPGPGGVAGPPRASTDGSVRDRGDGVVYVVAPAEDPTTHTATWVVDDPPACGVFDPGGATSLDATVVDELGRVRTEGAGWWLAEHAGLPVMPDRERVVRGLDRRFNAASLPEPGVPLDAKGLSGADPDAVARLVALLRTQVRVVPLATDPRMPRRLVRARQEGVATPLEAALFLRAWSGQIGLRSTWALARPAPDGAPLDLCPDTYDVPLAVFDVGDSAVWVDPACTVCGLGELPPDLEGAPVLGTFTTTPPPRTGSMTVVDRADGPRIRREVRLEGPAALTLRLELAELDAPARIPAIAARWAGPGGAVEALDGFADLGAPITIRLVGDVLPEPFDAPRATAAGPWWTWAGSRRWDDAAGVTQVLTVPARDGR